MTALEERSRPAGDQIGELVALFRERLAGRTASTQWAVIANAAFEDAQRFAEGIGEDARRLIVFSTLIPACTWLGVDPAHVVALVGELRSEALEHA